MPCATCTADNIQRQTAELAAAEVRIERRFGPWIEQRRPTNIVVLGADEMRDRWKQARATLLKDLNRREPFWRRRSDATIEREVDADLDEQLGQRELHAFALDGTVYITPEAPPSRVAHELLHEKFAPAGKRWVLEHSNRSTLNGLNESLDEYFNAQLETGPGAAPDAPAHYDLGPRVIRELRDDRLGGPEVGEDALRSLYFRGDPQPLVEHLERTPGGVRGFFDEYEQRVDRMADERGREQARRVIENLQAQQRAYEQEVARRAATAGAGATEPGPR